jgi:anti-sigma B factor antagonist
MHVRDDGSPGAPGPGGLRECRSPSVAGADVVEHRSPYSATFDIAAADGCAVVTARGEIDVASAASLRSALMDGLDRSQRVIVDLSDVTFLDCAGLSALTAGLRAARRSGGALRLVIHGGQAVSRLLTLTGLDQLFDVEESIDQAVARWHDPGRAWAGRTGGR